MTGRARGATIAALLTGVFAACTKTPPKAPVADVLNIPIPPARVLIPVQLAEPEEPPPAPASPPPVAAAPTRARETPPAPSRPVEQHPAPPAAASPADAAPAAVLQTTADANALEQQTLSVLAAAQRDLDRVRYADLGADARAQYDRAQGFIHMAKNALGIKNYMYAQQLAAKAAAVASLLAKG